MFNNGMNIGGRMDGPNNNMPNRGLHGGPAPRWGRPHDRDRADDFMAKRRRF